MKIYGAYRNGVPALATPIEGNGPDLQKVYGASIRKKEATCYFPAFYPFLPLIVEDLKTVCPGVEFTDKAMKLIQKETDRFNKMKNKVLDDPNFKFKTAPYAHQEKAFFHCLYMLRTALLLACGTGKSFVVISLLRYLKEPALIMCPPALINNWKLEIEKHSYKNDFVVESLDGSAKKKKELLAGKIDADILLVGYATARNYQEEIFNAFDYKVIVADESQSIKSMKSQQTKAALLLASKAYRRIIMSGTAVLNSPEDLYPQLRFLTPALVGTNYWKFRNTYLTFAPHNKHIIVGFKNMKILNKRVNSVALRYKKEDCLTYLNVWKYYVKYLCLLSRER